MARDTLPGSGQRLIVLEANEFHAETLFAFASAAELLATVESMSMFAVDYTGARAYLLDELGYAGAWRHYDELGDAATGADLVVANTFPSPGDQETIERVLATGRPLLGLVHRIGFFEERDGAPTALARHPNLWLAHAGVAPPDSVRKLERSLRRRVVRFVPVFRHEPACAPAERTAVSLPGSIEFSRRDFATALRLTAESKATLKIFGRSDDARHGAEVEALLARDRHRLFEFVAEQRLGPDVVQIGLDPSFRDFYRAVDGSRFVAVMPVNPEYLRGKLTGVVTAALSCGVPMLAPADVRRYHVDADARFERCMVAFDAHAPRGHANHWGALAGMSGRRYAELCAEVVRTRDALLSENAALLSQLLGQESVV